MAKTDFQRTDSIRVRLSADLMERFELIASRYGIAPATLATFAIAQFVHQEDYKMRVVDMAVSGMSELFSELFSGDTIDRIVQPVLQNFLKSDLASASSAGPAEPSEREGASAGEGGRSEARGS